MNYSHWPWKNQKKKRRVYISIGGNYLRDLRLVDEFREDRDDIHDVLAWRF